MIDATYVKVGILIIVAFVYALFDVFNKRDIPNFVVYSTILLGIVVAFVYNYNIIFTDIAYAVVIGILGSIIYKAGFLGGGDVLELVFVTLIMPIQNIPYYAGLNQLNLPFIISVIIGAGYTALVFMPLYYILYKRLFAGMALHGPGKRSVVLGSVLLIAYIAFITIFSYISQLSAVAVVLILLLAAASFMTLLFEKDIYSGMTSWISTKNLESGDMIAINLLDKKEVSYFRKKYSGFGRLVTSSLLKKLKGEKRKLPVYRDSVPFSLFIFLGILISLAFGNLILAIIGI